METQLLALGAQREEAFQQWSLRQTLEHVKCESVEVCARRRLQKTQVVDDMLHHRLVHVVRESKTLVETVHFY